MAERTDKVIGVVLRQLSLADQHRVLDFARSLAVSSPKGVPGKDLLRFAGMIPPEDLKQMRQAIQEGCEQIDGEGW